MSKYRIFKIENSIRHSKLYRCLNKLYTIHPCTTKMVIYNTKIIDEYVLVSVVIKKLDINY